MAAQAPSTAKVMATAALMAVLAAWQIYDIATATEAPSTALLVLQYVLLAGLLVGLAGAVMLLAKRR